MQQVSELTRSITRQSVESNRALPQESQQRPKLPQPHLDTLSLKMAEMFGHRWTGSIGVSVDQSHAWATVLGGITGKQIALGLAALAMSGAEWPPSAPAFRAMCLAGEVASLGLPSEAEAYREACEHAHPAGPDDWSSPVVRHAALMVGYWNLMHQPADVSRKSFAKEYAKAAAEAIAGREFPNPARALPAEIIIHATPAEAQAAREQLRAMIGRGK